MVDDLLESAKTAHMNMIRIWGGGMYESDYLYDRADEMGIMIWQDFMFACRYTYYKRIIFKNWPQICISSMYPATSAFKQKVEKELLYQIRRLQHHASLAVFAGNNENSHALAQNWYGTGRKKVKKRKMRNNYADMQTYKADYVNLFVDLVRRVAIEEAPDIPFLSTTPGNGIFDDRGGHLSREPAGWIYGDTHHYDRERNQWNASIYPVIHAKVFCPLYLVA